jgi:hypothetical protein
MGAESLSDTQSEKYMSTLWGQKSRQLWCSILWPGWIHLAFGSCAKTERERAIQEMELFWGFVEPICL